MDRWMGRAMSMGRLLGGEAAEGGVKRK